jgi:hypothetical protein
MLLFAEIKHHCCQQVTAIPATKLFGNALPAMASMILKIQSMLAIAVMKILALDVPKVVCVLLVLVIYLFAVIVQKKIIYATSVKFLRVNSF